MGIYRGLLPCCLCMPDRLGNKGSLLQGGGRKGGLMQKGDGGRGFGLTSAAMHWILKQQHWLILQWLQHMYMIQSHVLQLYIC